MTSRAHVQIDPCTFGVRLAVSRVQPSGSGSVLTWERPGVRVIEEIGAVATGDEWLQLEEDDARAIYEALAQFFGGAGHDTRALRKDYDAERKRVDRLIEAVVSR